MERNNKYRLIVVLILTTLTNAVTAQKQLSTNVLVIGGGTGGSAAGLQSARMGVNTIIAEPSVWLGGMLSAAGVPAFDGNHNMPSGIWAQFREQVYKVYGGPDKVATGWVSNTLFEPHVGDSILKAMASALPKLTVLFQHQFMKVIKNGTIIKGAVFYDLPSKRTVTIYAKQVIDATELGDVMASAAIPFDVGMEASAVTGENVNVPETNNIIQDITYAAILKDYGPKADCTLVKPTGYNPMEFDGCCNEFSSHPSKLTSDVSAQKMLDYGKLPNGKYMINWPGKGNDIYLNVIALTHQQRLQEWQKAKAKTMRFVYFLQTQFGFKNLALANDEFPTADRLPLIPYNREGRRLKGLIRFKIQHISDPFNQLSYLYRTGVAVGDYPIDHHHRENLSAPQHLGFYPVPSFNVPLGALIPEKHTGIIVAEKGISVSNIVNGTTRLQPCVMLTGQAAGALAALCIKQKKNAAQVSVRDVQQALLNSKAYIMPYYDVKPTDPHFSSIQKIGATGILKGTGQPNAWANRTWFYPDSLVTLNDLLEGLQDFRQQFSSGNVYIIINNAIKLIADLAEAYSGHIKSNKFPYANFKSLKQAIADHWSKWGLKNFQNNRQITRLELSVLLDKTVDPFMLEQPDSNGSIKQKMFK